MFRNPSAHQLPCSHRCPHQCASNLISLVDMPRITGTKSVSSGYLTQLLKMAIYSGFTHEKQGFSIAMLVYQRVTICKNISQWEGLFHISIYYGKKTMFETTNQLPSCQDTIFSLASQLSSNVMVGMLERSTPAPDFVDGNPTRWGPLDMSLALE